VSKAVEILPSFPLVQSHATPLAPWVSRCCFCARRLENTPAHGRITAMCIEPSSLWAVSGTDRGFLTLYDLRFQARTGRTRGLLHRLAQVQNECSCTCLSTRALTTLAAAAVQIPVRVWRVPEETPIHALHLYTPQLHRPHVCVASGLNRSVCGASWRGGSAKAEGQALLAFYFAWFPAASSSSVLHSLPSFLIFDLTSPGSAVTHAISSPAASAPAATVPVRATAPRASSVGGVVRLFRAHVHPAVAASHQETVRCWRDRVRRLRGRLHRHLADEARTPAPVTAGLAASSATPAGETANTPEGMSGDEGAFDFDRETLGGTRTVGEGDTLELLVGLRHAPLAHVL